MSTSLSEIEADISQKYTGKVPVNEVVKDYIASKLENSKPRKIENQLEINNSNKNHKHKKKHKKHKSADKADNQDSDEDVKIDKAKLIEVEQTYRNHILARQDRSKDKLAEGDSNDHFKNSKSRSKSREYRKVTTKYLDDDDVNVPVRSLEKRKMQQDSSAYSHLNRLSKTTADSKAKSRDRTHRAKARKFDSEEEIKSDDDKLIKRLKTMRSLRNSSQVIVLDDDDDDDIIIKNQTMPASLPTILPDDIPLPAKPLPRPNASTSSNQTNGDIVAGKPDSGNSKDGLTDQLDQATNAPTLSTSIKAETMPNKSQSGASDVKSEPELPGVTGAKHALKIKISDSSAAMISSGVVTEHAAENFPELDAKNEMKTIVEKELVPSFVEDVNQEKTGKNRKEKRSHKNESNKKEMSSERRKKSSKSSKTKSRRSRSDSSRSRSTSRRRHKYSSSRRRDSRDKRSHRKSKKPRDQSVMSSSPSPTPHRRRNRRSPSPWRSHNSRVTGRPKSRRSRSRDGDLMNFDKAKLREIAMKNALNNMSHGYGPIVDFKPEEVVSIRAGGKSVEELTDYCKKIAKGMVSRLDSDQPRKLDQDDVPFISYVKASKDIVMNIKNAKQVPIMTSQEKLLKSAKLTTQFPVSSGTDHRTNENEWTIVEKNNPFEEKIVAPVATESNDFKRSVHENVMANQMSATDIEINKKIEDMQLKIKNWAKEKNAQGKFVGSTGVKSGMSNKDLYGGAQAWAKQGSLAGAIPVTGGIGKLLLQRMGWKDGEGLGKDGLGMKVPIAVDLKFDRKGLVAVEENNKMMMSEILLKQANAQNKPFTGYVDLTNKHPVSVLMEMCSKKHWGAPEFLETPETMGGNVQHFRFKVRMNNVEYPNSPPNSNKKQAKMEAAILCLQELGLLPRQPLMAPSPSTPRPQITPPSTPMRPGLVSPRQPIVNNQEASRPAHPFFANQGNSLPRLPPLGNQHFQSPCQPSLGSGDPRQPLPGSALLQQQMNDRLLGVQIGQPSPQQPSPRQPLSWQPNGPLGGAEGGQMPPVVPVEAMPPMPLPPIPSSTLIGRP